MDFLSIRKKARERAEAKEGASTGPGTEARPTEPAPAEPASEPATVSGREPPVRERVPALEERRRRRGDEPVLTEADVAEGALQARFQGLAPSEDGRFATWRPGSGPPPVEPDPSGYGERTSPAPEPVEPRIVIASEPLPARAPMPMPAPAAPPDPLDLFFYRPDEDAAVLPSLGAPTTEEPPAAPTAIDEFLTFLLDKEEFAVPIRRVREVMRAPAITEVPRAPAHVKGVVTVRGEVVPVIDAHSRLGLGKASGDQARIVIVDAGEGPLGLVVDAVSSVVRLPAGSIEPCPPSIGASDCVTGIGRWRERLFMVVDVGTLLTRARAAEAR